MRCQAIPLDEVPFLALRPKPSQVKSGALLRLLFILVSLDLADNTSALFLSCPFLLSCCLPHLPLSLSPVFSVSLTLPWSLSIFLYLSEIIGSSRWKGCPMFIRTVPRVKQSEKRAPAFLGQVRRPTRVCSTIPEFHCPSNLGLR